MKYLNIILVVGLLGLTAIFYWFAIRPENVRKQCIDNAPLDTVQAQNLKDKDTVEQELRVLALRNAVYSSCLHENGLDR